ncbi:M13 family peptidase [Duganella sp. FT80W]|uniref:M13 family peptidase n=1 Tax=Duganella guangzhouensis TaxID=2666084 RepID=A0A6I2L5M1_9BURK|nr:M13 family metallopeptidase [Duganella guangzhouensis]MRW92507.1 M13 family peptidase [Duganella guangzhouensis]
MKVHLISLLIGSCVAVMAGAQPAPVAGIDTTAIDPAVRSQDDFFAHMNGRWLATTAIPPDRSGWGAYAQLDDEIQPQLRALIEDAVAHASADPERQRIGDFYASYMDEARLEQLGLAPLRAELARVAAVRGRQQLPALIAHLQQLGVATPYGYTVDQDSRDASRYVVLLDQDGLGLPDRDYYLRDDDPQLAATLARYQQHIGAMLALSGDSDSAANAQAIVTFERQLAKLQWNAVALQDPVKSYNKVAVAKLPQLAPGYDWAGYLHAAGMRGRVSELVIGQPSYFQGMAALLHDTPLPTLRAYFQWQLLRAFAPYLSKAYADKSFAFYGTALNGKTDPGPRWKRGVTLVNDNLGEALGKLYVRDYFPAERKQRMSALVGNVLDAFHQSIEQLDWMSAATKQQAQAKLAKLSVKIAYPDRWRDYTALRVRRDDLLGNVMRLRQFDNVRKLSKLGHPIERGEWGLSPQTVNAYYNPQLNEIVFPAAMLQPPFFNAAADDAVNYGAIGAVIGHEISHAFDDHGAQYDGDGNLRDWWSAADRQAYARKISTLVEQYDQFSPLPGYHVNGTLTLSENIADNSGLAIAYKAYRLSLQGQPAPLIDGLSGDQRFYMGYAQSRRIKLQDAALIRRLKTDPHAPGVARTNGPLRNQLEFYRAFDVQPGDGMYLEPALRVTIW